MEAISHRQKVTPQGVREFLRGEVVALSSLGCGLTYPTGGEGLLPLASANPILLLS